MTAFWLAADGPGPDPFPPPERLPPAADVVVVGGGVMGVSAAYWIARRGGSVLVLESSLRLVDEKACGAPDC